LLGGVQGISQVEITAPRSLGDEIDVRLDIILGAFAGLPRTRR
jgi:hypothetical protein